VPNDKDYNKAQVLIVGAGPAGLATAIQLKAIKPQINVCVIEKSADLGNHNLSGAVLEPQPLHTLLDSAVPGWQDTDTAKELLAKKVSKDNIMFFTKKFAFGISPIIKLTAIFHLGFGQMLHKGDYIVSISELTKWLGRIAKDLGTEVITGFAAQDIILDDDGVTKAPEGWPYNVGSKNGEACWGTHTCHMGVVKNLKALAEIPPSKISDGVMDIINKAAEYMLNHHVYKQSHNLDAVAKQEWVQFGFPLFWKIDALEVLDILTKIGFKDDRMKDAIDLIVSKQNENGRWILEKSFNGRMQANIEQKGKESKWITLFALRVLKRFYS